MDRYLIESPHNEIDCHLVLNQVHAMGFLHNFDWGCADGVHCGWVILEAESANQARMAVPAVSRKNARITRVVKFSEEQLKELHI